MHHMNKTTALFLALAAATSCKPETVTLGVTKDKDNNKTQAASHDTLKRASGPPTTHDKPSAPVAHQGAATPEIKSLSITHEKERQLRHAAAPPQRATKHSNILKTLYSANEQAALQRTSEESALQRAASTNNVKTLKAFISAGNAVEEKEGQAPWPAYAKAALELIEKKVDINAKDKDGNTPLHTAAKAGNTAKVWALIANKADINARDTRWISGGWTPLHWAAFCGHAAIVTLLIEADINAKDNLDKTPLHWAAQHGHIDVVRLLIANNADINAKNDSGYTPLHWAAWNGYIDVVRLLLDKGAYVNARNREGFTPLHRAARNGHKDVAALLRERGGH